MNELEQHRREKFKLVVYAVLVTSALILLTLLIYGARHSIQGQSSIDPKTESLPIDP